MRLLTADLFRFTTAGFPGPEDAELHAVEHQLRRNAKR